MTELTVTGIVDWCGVEAPVPDGLPCIMLQLELHNDKRISLHLREPDQGL